jgi:hypothetical protein
MGAVDWPEEGPQVDVWNHIETGLDLAREELYVLPHELRELTEKLGKAVVNVRLQLLHEDADGELIQLSEQILREQWVRYAAEFHLAEQAVQRATGALKRYLEITPALAAKPLPEKAQPYVKEAIRTFLFGFDPACIALCRAALEQVLKEVLLAKGAYTAPQLRKERPTAGALLENAKRAQLLGGAYQDAKRVIERGDTLMHRHIFDAKILKQMAGDSIRDFITATVSLLAAA